MVAQFAHHFLDELACHRVYVRVDRRHCHEFICVRAISFSKSAILFVAIIVAP